MPATPDSVYQLLKSYESQFQLPAPYVYLTVGALNVDNGTFTGLTTKSSTDPEPIEHSPGQTPKNPPGHFQGAEWITVSINSRWIRTITTEPAPHVALGPVQLVFNVSRPLPQGWSVTANGTTAQADGTQTNLSIDIWDAENASWTIQANGFSHTDALRIQRPAGILGGALGAFTIPVLPVTIVYAPPVNSLNKSTATYAQGQTVGQTTDFGTSTDQSQTVPLTVANLAAMTAMLGSTAGSISSQLQANSKLPPSEQLPSDQVAYLGLEGNLFSLASSQIGQINASQTQGITDQSDTQMTVITSTGTTFGTGASAGGPGQGDVIYFYHNLRMAWSYYQGGLRLCPIGYTNALHPVSAIQNDPASLGLSSQDAASLLKLDPFVAGGPSATPPAGRFQELDTWEYSHGAWALLSDTVTRDTKQTNTTINYTTDTSSWDAGPILKELGLGGSNQTTVKISNATGSDVSTTISIGGQLFSGPTDSFIVVVWYDTLFGTYAFQSLPPATSARLQGKGAKPGEALVLNIGRKKYHTVADKNGIYAFYAPSIPKGPAKLTIGSGPAQTVQIK